MRVPDFFIIGAPKCGTTSLYNYLKPHPGIYMPRVKEPYYYSSDFPGVRKFTDRNSYLTLYAEAEPSSLWGEASPWYLYSRNAVPQILNDNPEAKFIVCLRNPVDMFVSLHQQIRFNLQGDEPPLEVAWSESDSVRNDGQKRENLPLHPDYPAICSLGSQVLRLRVLVQPSKVHFVFFDDLSKNAAAVYRQTLGFLQLPDDRRNDFPVFNVRKEHYFPAVSRFIMHPPFPFNHLKVAVKRSLAAVGFTRPIHEFLSRPLPQKAELSDNFRGELVRYFSADIRLLEELVGRDLSAWRV